MVEVYKSFAPNSFLSKCVCLQVEVLFVKEIISKKNNNLVDFSRFSEMKMMVLFIWSLSRINSLCIHRTYDIDTHI